MLSAHGRGSQALTHTIRFSANDLAPLGIALTYDFNAPHDRNITTDTGWLISLGRGLDIYDKIGSRYALARQNPLLRRCKSCDIQFNRSSVVVALE